MKFILGRTITETFLKRVKATPDAIGFRYRPQGPFGPENWKNVTFSEFYGLCKDFSFGLMSLGAEKGDRIAIHSNTRFEWSVSDMAVLGANAITVPIYASSTAADCCYILAHSETKILIIENARQLLKLSESTEAEDESVVIPSSLKKIILIDSPGKKEQLELTAKGIETLTFEAVKKLGYEAQKNGPARFSDNLTRTRPQDILTISYTSGTTGVPKGAVLTHENLMSVLGDCLQVLGPSIQPKRETILSFLPFSHILGKVESMTIYPIGWTQAFAEGLDRLMSNLQEIRPTVIFAVPRTFEKADSLIRSAVRADSTLHQQLFKWACDIGTKHAKAAGSKQGPSLALVGKFLLAKSLVFDKVAARFGGRLRFAICGGAPLAKELGEFFRSAGFLILEGYGLTETCAPITLNTPEHVRFGTVGRPLPDVTIKIADDGEILVRSKKLFREYYKAPLETAESLTNGWFHTGDVGEIDRDGYLYVTDRKKDIIITSAGKNIAPQKIENIVKAHPLVGQFVVHGDGRNYLTALLTLDREKIIAYANQHNILFSEYSELIKNPRIVNLTQRVIDTINKKLASYETINKFVILPNEFTIESGELTPSLKVRRRFIAGKYKEILDAMYRDKTSKTFRS